MKSQKIFMVEDDRNFGAVLKSYLEIHGYDVNWVDDGAKAIKEYAPNLFDLCILDVMLPHVDGFDVARSIRNLNKDVPLIFLTAKTLKADVLEGFKIGADDYITKPFDSEVLLCKINAILKRNTNSDQEDKEIQNEFRIGIYNFIYNQRLVKNGDHTQKLSPKEAELLKLLCGPQDDILPREKALKLIWGDSNYFTTRSMDVFITKLRKYFREDPRVEIINIHGSGFRLIKPKLEA
jgi:two-component system, OmpR family, response regulator